MKPDGELAHQAEEKAEILRQSFFPSPLRADLLDIDEYEYPQSIECLEITPREIVKGDPEQGP
jgi:hypothetical protein